MLRCTNHFTHPEECKRNHSVFYDDLIESVQNDMSTHMMLTGDSATAVIPLTRSTVIKWIDYIEIGHSGSSDDDTCRNQVMVHYIEPAKEKQKWRGRKPDRFYGW